MSEVGVGGAGGEDEVVVLGAAAVEADEPFGEVDGADLGEDDAVVGDPAEDAADGAGDVGGGEGGGGDLVEEGLEEVVVAAVDEGDADGCLGEALGGGDAGEAAADDVDAGEFGVGGVGGVHMDLV